MLLAKAQKRYKKQVDARGHKVVHVVGQNVLLNMKNLTMCPSKVYAQICKYVLDHRTSVQDCV